MKICKQCGAKIPDDAKQCPICGNKQLDEAIIMLCPSCGAINLSESKHCIKCGAHLHEEEKEEQVKPSPIVSEPNEGPKEEIAKVCPNCGYVNSLGNRFCNMCGQPMFVHKEERHEVPLKQPQRKYIEEEDDEVYEDYETRGTRRNRLFNLASFIFACGFIFSLLFTWFLKKTGLGILFEITKVLSGSNETVFGLGALGRVFLLASIVLSIVGGVLALVNTFRGEKASRFICVASIVLTVAYGFSFLFFYQELLSSIKIAFYLGALSNIIFGALGLFTNDEYEDYEDDDEDL